MKFKTGEIIKLCAEGTMERTIVEENNAADNRGDKDSENYCNITVVVDGGWCKCSCGRGYNISSTVAVIIDQE